MLEDVFACTFLVKMKSVPPTEWTPDVMSDLVDGVNKFGTDWRENQKGV